MADQVEVSPTHEEVEMEFTRAQPKVHATGASTA
jgi:hypothetical protein